MTLSSESRLVVDVKEKDDGSSGFTLKMSEVTHLLQFKGSCVYLGGLRSERR